MQGLRSVVTGGSKAIGGAITLALAREGTNVAIIANRDLRNAEKVAKKIDLISQQEYHSDNSLCIFLDVI